VENAKSWLSLYSLQTVEPWVFDIMDLRNYFRF